ncbi:uncharacterized protein ISCGN_006655 [Ixodes scapularis]
MRKVLEGIPGVSHYFDDVLIASDEWEEHLATLREVFERIQRAGLTVRPSKCEIGFREITFLGHRIGQGEVAPVHSILEKIKDVQRPTTKRQVRSFLGLTGYYRDFIPDYATIASPLSDLTKKGTPNNVPWREEQDKAFTELKKKLANPPILRLPNLDRPFVLRTDASDRGVGAVLMQEHDAVLHPVAYASRKLLPREMSYATIEREGLALVASTVRDATATKVNDPRLWRTAATSRGSPSQATDLRCVHASASLVVPDCAKSGTTRLAEAWTHLRSVACDGLCLDVAAVRQRRGLLALDAVASRTVDALEQSGRGRPHRVGAQK